ncbi:uncharacterized protein THITE_52821 [Thermothielavioides terrestris NRRL 8126]|uniref:Cytochrome b5 heme-binding domain-containing protein n=1 Tax=Thermothielavioides terrestris (strain ATCC 38088 / NRRL 8126) TaxID=578455 RepID=G2R8D7_THETT|nr:uncharacterized protein THITE_52821 [Thermothielavioides terrestris NRRL 8126]AEO68195.1 hypothetical protein THITE_52821 [Thermothielavioides terrestris NRRL 8126]
MATRAPSHFATNLLRQIGRRDAAELTICRRCRLRPRRIHTTARLASRDPAPITQRPLPPTVARTRLQQARVAPLSLLVGGGLLASLLAYNQLGDDRPTATTTPLTDDRDPSLPRFRLAEIRKHDSSSSQPWVTFEDKVYDITDWVPAHPGGDVILRAAGAAIEPYWNIFTIHKSQHVRDILEQYLIGYIDKADLGPDGLPAAETIEDPFVDDPVRDPRLITHTAKPRNAEPPNEELDRTFRTPNELFYIRHHMWVPVVDESKADEHVLTWQRRDYKSFGPNEGANPDWDRALSIQEMPVTSAITGVWVGDCVRRGRVPWMGSKEIAHATSQQPDQSSRILDMAAVPKKVGFTPESRTSIPPSSADTPCPSETPAEPIALQGYAYSGGGRAIARVDVSLDGGKTWDQAELVDDCGSGDGSGGGGCFGNKTWTWKRWRYVGKLPVLSLPNDDDGGAATANDGGAAADKGSGGGGGCHDRRRPKHCTTLVVKATDDAYNTQPESHRGIYNVRGNLATAWHRVKICPRCTDNGDGKGLTWSTGETYGCGFRKEAEEVLEGMRRQGATPGNGAAPGVGKQ